MGRSSRNMKVTRSIKVISHSLSEGLGRGKGLDLKHTAEKILTRLARAWIGKMEAGKALRQLPLEIS